MSSGDVELDDRSHTRRLILLLTTLVVLPGILFTLWVVRANPNPDPTTDPASATSPLVNALALNVGDCLNSGALDDPNLVLPAPCTLQHDATVFANASLTTADVSTDESIRAAADRVCQAAIPASSAKDAQVSFFYPTAEDATDSGDRRLTCVFDNTGDPVTP